MNFLAVSFLVSLAGVFIISIILRKKGKRLCADKNEINSMDYYKDVYYFGTAMFVLSSILIIISVVIVFIFEFML